MLTALGLLLACPTVVACRGQDHDADAKRVVPGSTADATQAITDEARRFRLAWPGPGWKLLGEADALGLHPDAAAGAVSEDGITAVVIVRPAPSVPLGDYCDRLMAGMPLDEKSVSANETTTLSGHDAQRFALTGKAGGAALRYSGIALGADGRIVRLVAWRSASAPCPDDTCFAPFFKAFSLLDGAPKAVAPAAAPSGAEHGVDWKVKDATFESSVSGLRVVPPAGWRLLWGSRLEGVDSEAEVGLVAPETGLTLLLGSAPAQPAQAPTAPAPPEIRGPGAPRPPVPGAPRPTGGATPAGGPSGAAQAPPPVCHGPTQTPSAGESLLVPGEIGGGRFELLGGSAGDSDVLAGALPHESRCVWVQARYPSAARTQARALLATGLAGVGFMTPADTAALGDELQQAGDGQNAVGPDFALRNSSYRSFRWRLAWAKPEGPWRMKPEPTGSGLSKGALLAVEHRGLGLHALLWAEAVSSGDQEAYHQHAMELRGTQLNQTFRRAGGLTIDGGEARVSEADATDGGGARRYRLVTSLRVSTGLQLLIWGPAATMTKHADTVTAIGDALQLRPALTPIESKADVYRDHRLGFELIPPSTWTFLDLTPPELTTVGTFLRWEREGRWVAVVAVCLPEGLPSTEWFVGFLEQLLRDAVGPIARGAPDRSETRLAGRPARHVVWQAPLQRIDAAVASSDNTVIALVTLDRSEESFQKLAPGLVLLP